LVLLKTIRNNKEISSRELRILQVYFHYDSLLEILRKSPPESSGELRILQVHFPYNSLLKTIRNLLPRAPDPPGPFSLQFFIKNNKEFAPESSGSSRSIFLMVPYEKQ
jgi:hypothetical protein